MDKIQKNAKFQTTRRNGRPDSLWAGSDVIVPQKIPDTVNTQPGAFVSHLSIDDTVVQTQGQAT